MPKYSMSACLILMSLFQFQGTLASEQRLFVGTNAPEQGIYASTLDLVTGEFSPAQAVGDAPYPGFLALHPRLPILYSISREKDERPSGGLRSFHIETGAKALTLINCQTTGDEGTTHLALDPAGKNIVVANYTGEVLRCCRCPTKVLSNLSLRSSSIQDLAFTPPDKANLTLMALLLMRRGNSPASLTWAPTK